MLLIYLSVLVLFLSIFIFIMKQHLLMNLICIEILMFFNMIMYLYYMNFYIMSMTYFVSLLCFSASGAAIGLVLLVAMGRQYGNDYVKSYQYEKNSNFSEFI
uniref:NADH dehydrogenase subunit 4L n=1 Tax=Cochlostyla marinduquensis TaxID=2079772 RepID=UPI00233E8E5E|nr:NADH dehydrogenase subunit 4L [Cochlostyla marinduquensis]UIX22049.1 NADH dehydrogenase subunit 4L [Cochlostyla marinduquensis]